MKTTHKIITLNVMLLLSFVTYAQSPAMWQNQTAPGYVETGTTPNDYGSSYSWQELTNKLQGVHINLIPTELVKIYTEQNHSVINFTTRIDQTSAVDYMLIIELSIDNANYFVLYQGAAKQDIVS